MNRETIRALVCVLVCLLAVGCAAAKAKSDTKQGYQALAKDDTATAATQFATAAQAGNAEAQFQYAMLLTKGGGVAKDQTKAVEWMSKSAAQEYAPALYTLGLWQFSGHGLKQDTQAAVRNIEAAARKEDGDAAYLMGALASTGNGMSRDLEQAKGWFRLAKANGVKVDDALLASGDITQTPGYKASAAKTTAADKPKAANLNRNQLVQELQKGLRGLGYDVGKTDGSLNKKTGNAIRAYQKARKLKVDGQPTAALLEKIWSEAN